MIITSLYKLSPPPAQLVNARNEKIKQVIEQMGDKYLLAKPVQRIQDDKRN